MGTIKKYLHTNSATHDDGPPFAVRLCTISQGRVRGAVEPSLPLASARAKDPP